MNNTGSTSCPTRDRKDQVETDAIIYRDEYSITMATLLLDKGKRKENIKMSHNPCAAKQTRYNGNKKEKGGGKKGIFISRLSASSSLPSLQRCR